MNYKIDAPDFNLDDACGCRHSTSVLYYLLKYYKIEISSISTAMSILLENLTEDPDQRYGYPGKN